MQSVTVSLREFLPVRVAGVWPDPDEVCEFGGTGLVGPVDPLALDWPYQTGHRSWPQCRCLAFLMSTRPASPWMFRPGSSPCRLAS